MDLTQFGGTDKDVDGLLHRQQARRTQRQDNKRKDADCRPIPKHEQGDWFVRGPVPYTWLQAALAIGGKAGNLAWAIWWLVGVKKTNPIRLTGQVLRDFRVSPRTARRLLLDFEQAGLVEVDRQRGRGPDVTLLSLGAREQQTKKPDHVECPRTNAKGDL